MNLSRDRHNNNSHYSLYLTLLTDFLPSYCVSLADLGEGCAGRTPPPMGPNSFIFTYIFTKKHPCWRSMPPLTDASPPPTGNPGSATLCVCVCDLIRLLLSNAVAYPGFPVGGHRPVGGGANLLPARFSVETYETERNGPRWIGSPGSTNEHNDSH